MAQFTSDDLIVNDDEDRYVTLAHGDTVVSIKAGVNDAGDLVLVVQAKRGQDRTAQIGVVSGWGDNTKTLPDTGSTSAGQNSHEEITLTIGEQVHYVPTGAPNEYAVYVNDELLGAAEIPSPRAREAVLAQLKENA